ncbi:hypothetical protein OXPF_22020 [Oxobacter pfennigii]|uniref:Division initiation protein n=1 Tax=Oxobacter pfennigii TaxID=36849 RepID=A0A0P8WZU9_9CLOT|nr:DUF881 domain-containing protein [Oxobacter pfennigii]KPU44036.1 hypothetical protein OXPF_22020 [Oxobacter pfennigii]
MKSFKAQLYVAVVCIVLGLMLAYQFRAVKNISTLASSKRILELTNELNEAKKQKEDMEKNVRDLELKIEEFENSVSNTDAITNSLKRELDRVRIIGGLTKVEGPGVIIKVTPQMQNLDNINLVPVSFIHLLLVLNELNASGAEAIMVNNQRIVSTTQIRDAGSMIIINDVRYSAFEEFEIKAIGDPVILESAMNMAGGIRQELVNSGIGCTIQKSDNVVILKYNKVIDFKYVIPVKEGE